MKNTIEYKHYKYDLQHKKELIYKDEYDIDITSHNNDRFSINNLYNISCTQVGHQL